ncbi:uncharacterized protein [Oscarella lobularis]|uniref:uncharacterized protein n=1 Tax=Oscarella lobularis TaxID=121494 RepID=UPI00331391D7
MPRILSLSCFPLCLGLFLLSKSGGTTITINRLPDGDEFTSPFGCLNNDQLKCPSSASVTASSKCMCKCPDQNTWMQDMGKCVDASDCSYSLAKEGSILAMSFPRNGNISPKTPVLFREASGETLWSPVTSGDLSIKSMRYLKSSQWTESIIAAEGNNFKFAFEKQGKRYYLQGGAQDLDGAVINFTVASSCLIIKITGVASYNSTLEPSPTTTQLPTAVSSSAYLTTEPKPSHLTANLTTSSSLTSTSNTDQTTVLPIDRTVLPTARATDYDISVAPESQSNASAITGGLIGGLLGIVIIVLIVVILILVRRNRSKTFVVETERNGAQSPEATNPVFSNGRVYEKTSTDERLYEEIGTRETINDQRMVSDDGYEVPIEARKKAPYKEPVSLAGKN